MIPWVLIDIAPVPGGGELRLLRRGDEFSIMLGGNELMNSRKSGSEEKLAELAIAKMRSAQSPVMLIGGLGMGFTLRAALKALPPGATVHVAELVPTIVEWAKGPLRELFESCLDDPRVHVSLLNVRDVIQKASALYDAILLDIDNGPGGIVHPDNDAVYSIAGLNAARKALRPGGSIAVWSAHPDDQFTRRLESANLRVETHSIRAHGKRGARHTVWLATRQ